MTLYNQRNYPNTVLGFGPTTIGTHGCKLTCFSIITGIDPETLNEKFKKDGCFTRDLLFDPKIALSLEIEHYGTQSTNPDRICLVEVDMSPSLGKQQHFVVWMNDGNIIDPWTGSVRPANTYPIINYRVFNFDKYLNTNNTMELTKDQKKELTKLGFDFGDNLNSGELDKLIKKCNDLQEAQPTNCDSYIQEVEDLKVENQTLHARITELEPKADIGNRFMEVSKMANNA